MIKIRKIAFKDHPILRNLTLDFCGRDGKAVDTVIFAGENGCGKSTIVNAICNALDSTFMGLSRIEWEKENVNHFVDIKYEDKGVRCTDDAGMPMYGIVSLQRYNEGEPINTIFSDVDINFKTDLIKSVTSRNLDTVKGNVRSDINFPTGIKQLLVDIQALDNDAIAHEVETNPNIAYKDLKVEKRMSRFTNAFNKMFDDLKYSRVSNSNGHKDILFEKYGKEITIDQLSSGEKQIVYRGCFLLKDREALNGAFVFIDEPEISLHPIWQKKIMDYYKGIFTNAEGVQTSQIFAVTHSPFVIHNENRKNDKVIVLKRDAEGKIVVEENPEYYDCSSTKVIEDAFSISDFTERQYDADQSCVYLEGRTDEKYFNKALDVFGYKDVPFQFKWVGYIDDKGQEANTGKDALNKAAEFLKGKNLPFKNICLFDNDTNKPNSEKNNVYIKTLSVYPNMKKIKIGIENALVLDDIDITHFYTIKEKEDDYGGITTTQKPDKMKLCSFICSLGNEDLKKVFVHLKEEIDSLLMIFRS
jgi:predicted ATP-binding protein involved in virulence